MAVLNDIKTSEKMEKDIANFKYKYNVTETRKKTFKLRFNKLVKEYLEYNKEKNIIGNIGEKELNIDGL